MTFGRRTLASGEGRLDSYNSPCTVAPQAKILGVMLSSERFSFKKFIPVQLRRRREKFLTCINYKGIFQVKILHLEIPLKMDVKITPPLKFGCEISIKQNMGPVWGGVNL